MNAEFKKYLDLIASMTVDCLMGGITPECYMNNLETAVRLIKERNVLPSPINTASPKDL
jgi:hypothetical protein